MTDRAGGRAPSAGAIRVDPRPSGCPIARSDKQAAAVQAMIRRERDRHHT